MTDSPDEYGELLRRALSAEANSVVPSPDGLEIIRARVERRGLRGLMWWRVGASVAGAVLVAGAVVMVVPQFRDQVIPQVSTGDVNFTESAPPDLSATSRLPSNTVQIPAVTKPDPTPPPPTPTPSKSTAPSPKPTPTPKPTPKPTPSPTCPTLDDTPIEPEGLSERCEETEATTPTPSESTTTSTNPCSVEECPPPDEPPPTPTEASTPVPTPVAS